MRLCGDAYILITGTFFPDHDPLAEHPGFRDPGEDITMQGDGVAFRRGTLDWKRFFRGSLVIEYPDTAGELLAFRGDNDWLAGLRERLQEKVPGLHAVEEITLEGVLFSDGFGSVAVTFQIPGGWEEQQEATMSAFGPEAGDGPGWSQQDEAEHRDLLAKHLQAELLEPVAQLLHRCDPTRSVTARFPYFNLAYAGDVNQPEPGRQVLDDRYRWLVYPEFVEPLTSNSPWRDEFLYTGYAYHLLACVNPAHRLGKLAVLLMILNVTYARMAGFADAAENHLREGALGSNVELLARIERRLRSEYEALVTPTFSFDHHALMLRDSILQSWNLPKLQARTEGMISMVRNAVEFRIAQQQARRVNRLNWLVITLTGVAAIPTFQAILELIDRFTT